MATDTKKETTTTTQTEKSLEEMLGETLEATPRFQSMRHDTAKALGVTEDIVYDMLRNVWPVSDKNGGPLTAREMFLGMSLISRHDLDPITKEIYVTRNKEKGLLTIIGIDGWVKVLNRTPDYDGFDQEDEITDKGKVVKITTKIFSKSRSHPTVYPAYWIEYERVAGFVKNKMPIHMLRLFSIRHAARLFTNIGGVTTAEEAEMMDDQPADNGRNFKIPKSSLEQDQKLIEEQLKPGLTVDRLETKSEPHHAPIPDQDEREQPRYLEGLGDAIEGCKTLKELMELLGQRDAKCDTLEQSDALGQIITEAKTKFE